MFHYMHTPWSIYYKQKIIRFSYNSYGALVFRCIKHLPVVMIPELYVYFWPGEEFKHPAQLLGHAFSD